MDRDRALEMLQSEALRETDLRRDQGEVPVVILSGGNQQSSKAFFDRETTVRYFPFQIGRAGQSETISLDDPDLLLKDRRPYKLSRLHLILNRRGADIYLVDPNSRYGSLVDKKPLGKSIGGPAELALPPGKHRVQMGGKNSPFVFDVRIIGDDNSYSRGEQIQIGDRKLPASVLYDRLFRYTQTILHRFFDNGRQGLKMAAELVKSLLQYPEILDPIYYFSALPENRGDAMVAHSLNVAIYTLRLARSIPVPDEDLMPLCLAALLHDIGMYDISQEIIEKREAVTAEEFEVIKRHPLAGKNRLIDLPGADPLIPRTALEHHERIDGNGYPLGIKDISEYVELIAMVDFFEALTHFRPQRGPVTPHAGMRMLIELRRAIFSPDKLRVFIKGFSLYPIFSVVRLNTGEIGQVVGTQPNYPLRPTVRIFFNRFGGWVSDEKVIDLHDQDHVYIARDISDRIFVDHYFRL